MILSRKTKLKINNIMENSTLLIDSKKRLALSKGNRIYQSLYGILLIIIVASQIIKSDSALFNIGLALIGILSLVYGIIGKKIFLTHNYFRIDSNLITSKNSGERKDVIDIKSITHIKILQSAFEITLNDYVKEINLEWMTADEFQMIKARLEGIKITK